MKWVPDPTGRFPRRPYYEEGELDNLCEQAISNFLVGRHGKVLLPISTDDLTVLIGQDAEDLDLYADLSGEGGEAQGVTHFGRGRVTKFTAKAVLCYCSSSSSSTYLA